MQVAGVLVTGWVCFDPGLSHSFPKLTTDLRCSSFNMRVITSTRGSHHPGARFHWPIRMELSFCWTNRKFVMVRGERRAQHHHPWLLGHIHGELYALALGTDWGAEFKNTHKVQDEYFSKWCQGGGGQPTWDMFPSVAHMAYISLEHPTLLRNG